MLKTNDNKTMIEWWAEAGEAPDYMALQLGIREREVLEILTEEGWERCDFCMQLARDPIVHQKMTYCDSCFEEGDPWL